ncbi:hypothetical protein E2493_02750 [Sphingomonas parva]|uniref:Lipoprotein n=1 Tax=Sphingomonas parva TaxID=2555898 RepID=A0A4Y8ZV36_9SPHN|nr:hypothetical protein [Sphingomonas parva]TFI59774.1 hypothetical protein E2493_02750 [Sphingomonas parva]
MKGKVVSALVLSSALAGCSAAKDTSAPSTEILCAAEALKASRGASSAAAQDLLLNKATIFEQKLPASQHDSAHRAAEALADRRGTTPLVEPAACDALLSPADRQRLRDEQS